ncbi:hypothetical protein LTS08_008922 [Lithohypha guttulata]|uniref:uncharacterized protein n=1 Tax=Lithohypha guttulata TaxID=1690604 RepID=UPI002DE07D03|nr:hypothetical protein LTS08_008922 [Lithohypha guttulata]
MSVDFTFEDTWSLFGVNQNLIAHLERLQATGLFYQIRKEIERNKTRLASLTAVNFKKGASKFREHIEEIITNSDICERRDLVLPLIQNKVTRENVQQFIVANLSLSKAHCRNLAKANMTTIFPQLFIAVVGAVVIPSETTAAILATIKEICTKTESVFSTTVLEAVTEGYANIAVDFDKLTDKHGTKRMRLENDSNFMHAVHARSFSPLKLANEAIDDEIESDEPLNMIARQIVIQFSAAEANRLEGVFGPSPLLEAVKRSRQWRWERAKDEISSNLRQQQTDCMIALIPDSNDQDFSFVIRVGYSVGWQIVKYLNYGESSEQTPTAV